MAAQGRRREITGHPAARWPTDLCSIKRFTEAIQDIRRRFEAVASTLALRTIPMTIINEILDFSKLDAGHLKLRDEDIDVRGIVDASFNLVECHAVDAGVVLHRDVAADLPSLLADPHRVGQMLLNILSNAVKFTPRGGNVRVAAARCGADLAHGQIRPRADPTGIHFHPLRSRTAAA